MNFSLASLMRFDYLPFSLLICGQDNIHVCLPDTVKIFISIQQREMYHFWQKTVQWLLINEEQQPLDMIICCLTKKEKRENKIQVSSYSKNWLFFSHNRFICIQGNTTCCCPGKTGFQLYIFTPFCAHSPFPQL